MTSTPDVEMFTDGQRAALARITCGSEQPGSLALLCGPPGTGKSSVLARLAAGAARRNRSCAVRRLTDWIDERADGEAVPDLVIADDAHDGDAETIGRLLASCRSRRPAAAVVLAGEGRLLTLVSRDQRIEQGIGLRATLHPFSVAETRRLLEPLLPGLVATPSFDDVARTIHEIAAGIPRAALKLAELAAIVAGSRADGSLGAADVERIHRRLSLQAA